MDAFQALIVWWPGAWPTFCTERRCSIWIRTWIAWRCTQAWRTIITFVLFFVCAKCVLLVYCSENNGERRTQRQCLVEYTKWRCECCSWFAHKKYSRIWGRRNQSNRPRGPRFVAVDVAYLSGCVHAWNNAKNSYIIRPNEERLCWEYIGICFARDIDGESACNKWQVE